MSQTATQPRIAPIEPPYDPDTEAQLAKWMPPGSPMEPLVLFRTLMVHPDLAARMRPLGSAILGHGRLEPRTRELMILRTCALCGAEYEWGVHVTAFAGAVGLTEREIAATALAETDGPDWSAHDRLVIRLADELHGGATVSQALWEDLTQVWSPAEILELVITAGWYRTLSYVINAARIELEPWAARFSATPARPG
jgi:alkylhydroperoxidase family enzyme